MPERDANQLAADARRAINYAKAKTVTGTEDYANLRRADAALDELVGLVGTLQQERDAERRWCKHWAERAEAAEATAEALRQERDEAWPMGTPGAERLVYWYRRAVAAEAALAWYDDHKRDDGSYDGEMWGDLRALADTGGDTKEPA